MVDTDSIASPSLTLKVSAPIKTHLAIHTHLATALNTSEKCTSVILGTQYTARNIPIDITRNYGSFIPDGNHHSFQVKFQFPSVERGPNIL